MSNARVAMCVIANEVLTGKTLESNSHYLGILRSFAFNLMLQLARQFFRIGLHLKHVRVIPDEEKEIIDNVLELSAKYPLVFTSGGIGPTHDDITFLSIAKAFNRPLHHNEQLINQMKSRFAVSEVNEGQKRMALLPKAEHIYYNPSLPTVPLVQVQNVYILPGVPSLFQQLLDYWIVNVLPNLHLPLQPRVRKFVKTFWKESSIATRLAELQENVNSDGLELGSYPKMPVDGPSYVVISVIGDAPKINLIDQLVDTLIKDFNGALLEI